MAQPDSNAELVRRLHTAILALEPDLELPLPPTDDPRAVAELLGVLAGFTDHLLCRQPDEHMMHSAGAYNQFLGHSREQADRKPMYEHFSGRIRLTGLALTPVGGRGVVTMTNGCLVAAYEGTRLGAEFESELAQAQPDQPLPERVREQVNERLVNAQKYMEKAREGVAMLAGYPEGTGPTEADGQVLESDDERITQIVDMGSSVIIDYAFATPDGPVRSRGQALLDGVAELVGLSAAERSELIVRMVEADLDRVEAQTLQAPPAPEA